MMDLTSVKSEASVVSQPPLVQFRKVARMKWWLTVFFLINGQWIAGDRLPQPGWSARAYSSESECQMRKAAAETYCETQGLQQKMMWFCSKGKPLEAPPDELLGVPC